MKYLLPLLLVGCAAGPSLSELEDSYFQCTADRAESCELIAEEMDRKIAARKARAEREYRKMCSDFGSRCYYGKEAQAIARAHQGVF